MNQSAKEKISHFIIHNFRSYIYNHTQRKRRYVCSYIGHKCKYVHSYRFQIVKDDGCLDFGRKFNFVKLIVVITSSDF